MSGALGLSKPQAALAKLTSLIGLAPAAPMAPELVTRTVPVVDSARMPSSAPAENAELVFSGPLLVTVFEPVPVFDPRR